MTIEIKQDVSVSIPQLADISSVVERLAGQMQSLVEMFTIPDPDSTPGRESPRDTLKAFSDPPKVDPTARESFAVKLQNLIDALQNNTTAMKKDYAAELQHRRNLNNLDDEQRAKKRQERKDDREELDAIRRQQGNRNWARSIAYGAGMLAVGSAGQFGRIAGSEAQSLNAGTLNYSDFMTNYYNRQADAKQSLISGGLMAGAGILTAINPFIGIPAMVGAGAINYFTGKSTEQDKATSQFARSQELSAWRLNMSGLGGKPSGSGINSGYGYTPIGENQLTSLSPRYAPYAATFSDVMLGGKRDVISSLKTSKDMNEYNRQLTLTAMAMGTSDIGGLNKSVTTLAGITGETPSQTLSKLLDTNEKYGGDTASNTARLVQILETTPLGYSAASDLVNRYQYNPAMLNNQLALATASPLDALRQQIIMNIDPGATAAEKRAGQYNSKHIQEVAHNAAAIRKGNLGAFNPIMQLRTMSTVPGQSFWPQDIAGVTPGTSPYTPANENTTMKAFGDFVRNSLSNIVVPSQTVHADQVVLMGKRVEGAGVEFMKAVPQKNINTGAGQPTDPKRK